MKETYNQKHRSAPESQAADPPTPGAYIIKGDVSGIQDYIFNVSSKGAARTLHAHSKNVMKLEEKYLKALTERLENMNPKAHKGGGGFHVILEKEAAEGIEQVLNAFQQEINAELKYAPISVRLSYGFGEHFKDAWKSLRENNNTKRFQQYGKIEQPLFEELFDTFTTKETAFDDWLAPIELSSPTIENQRWDAELIAIHKNQKGSNNEEAEPGKLIDFDGYASFAKERTETDFLGVLKMDVDSLGNLFGNCKSNDEFAALSGFFNEFFGKKNIENLLAQKLPGNHDRDWTYHQNIYTVFAGGDDCFFIGSWDAILPFAQIIRSEFINQVKEKLKRTDITLSAGIVLLDSKTPVVQLGKMAEETLSKAKSRSVNSRTVKDGISLMNEIFSWDEFEGILKHTDTLVGFLSDKKITRGLLEKIKKSSIGFESLQDRIKKRKKLPFDRVYKLKYYLRDVKKEHIEEVETKIFQPYIYSLTKALMSSDDSQYSNPMRFPLAARLAEFKTRKNTKNE